MSERRAESGFAVGRRAKAEQFLRAARGDQERVSAGRKARALVEVARSLPV